MPDDAPGRLFRQGQVAKLSYDFGHYYVRFRRNVDGPAFDVVMTNRKDVFCDRRRMGRGWVRRQFKRANGVAWSAESDDTAREFWPLG
jgi:hypothetical protein